MEAKHHEGEITDVPQGFKDWVGRNEERIEHAKSMPSFLKDNTQYWEGKEKKWGKKMKTSNTFTFPEKSKPFVDADSDKEAYKRRKKEVKELLQRQGTIKITSDRLSTGRLLFGKNAREALLYHSHDSDELYAIEKLSNIVKSMTGGQREELDKSRPNYQKKKDKYGFQYMVRYELTINGFSYVLKNAAIKGKSLQGKLYEQPYSLKKKK